MVPCSDEARVPRYLFQASRQRALCPKAHRAESEGVLQLNKFPASARPFLSRARECSPGRVWLLILMPFSALAFWDLGMEQGFPSGVLGGLVPVQLLLLGETSSRCPYCTRRCPYRLVAFPPHPTLSTTSLQSWTGY